MRKQQLWLCWRYLCTFDSYPTLSLFTLCVCNSRHSCGFFHFLFMVIAWVHRRWTIPLRILIFLLGSLFFSYVSRFDVFFFAPPDMCLTQCEKRQLTCPFWNLLQASRHVGDLFEDLRDGHNLISLLEVLSGEHLVSTFRDALGAISLIFIFHYYLNL